MLIEYFGHSCFLVHCSFGTVCIDPFSNIGLKEPNCKADYYFSTHDHYDHSNVKIVGGKPLDDKVNFSIVETFHDKKQGALRGKNNVLILNDEVTLAHLGDLGDTDNFNLITALKDIDILLCPIGGNYTIDYLEAIDLINKVKPKIVIPMHYKMGASTVDIDTLDNFIKNTDFGITCSNNKINITNKDILQGQTRIYIINIDR